MKKLSILLFAVILFAGCKSVKVAGEVTSFAATDSSVSMGIHAKAAGTLKPSTMDSIFRGLPVVIANQSIQVLHTDSTVDLFIMLNVKSK